MDPAQPVETTIQSVEWEELVHLRNEIAKKEREASDWQHKALTLKRERDMKHSEVEAARRDVCTFYIDDRQTIDHSFWQLSAALEREAAQIKRNEELRVLLETRRRELQDAQRFMGTIDTSSEGDVFRHLRELNAGIFNLARSISETQVGAGNASNRAKGKAEEALAVELGRPLLDMLKSFDTRDDAILFEISVQAVVTSVLFWMISTWTNDPDGDAVVSSIHKRIQHTGECPSWCCVHHCTESSAESQSVAGQWRALAWKAAQTEFIGGPQWEHHCKERLVTVITHAAALSGMRISVSKSKHMETIAILAEKASKIRHLIGEAMVGSDYEVVLPKSGSPYATAEMEEAYAPKGKSRRQGTPVICSTTLGLRRVETVQGKRQATMLVKPAVCLDTLLEDLGLTDGGEKMSTSA